MPEEPIAQVARGDVSRRAGLIRPFIVMDVVARAQELERMDAGEEIGQVASHAAAMIMMSDNVGKHGGSIAVGNAGRKCGASLIWRDDG